MRMPGATTCIVAFVLITLIILMLRLLRKGAGKNSDVHEEKTGSNLWLAGIVLVLFVKVLFGYILLIKDQGFLSGDDYARMDYIANWARDPYFSHGGNVWPSGHFWVLGFFVRYFSNDVELVVRLSSMISGLLCLVFMGLLTRRLTGKNPAAFFAVLIFASFPLHTWMSVSALVDIHFWMFLLSGAWLFSTYAMKKHRKNPWLLIGACFMLGAASSLRYEAWIFNLFFFILLVILQMKENEFHWSIKKLFLISICGIFLFWFPVAWMLDCYFRTGSFLEFLKNNTGLINVTSHSDPLRLKIFNFLEYPKIALLKALFILPLILLGIYQHLVGKKRILRSSFNVLLFSLIILAALSVVAAFSGHSQNLRMRIPFVTVIFMIPFTAASLMLLWNELNERRIFQKSFFWVLPVIIIFPYLGFHFETPSSNWILGTDTVATASFLRNEFKTWNMFPTKNMNSFEVSLWTPWEMAETGTYGAIQGRSGRKDLVKPQWRPGNYPDPDFWSSEDSSICITGFRKLISPPGEHLFDIGRYSFYKDEKAQPFYSSEILGLKEEIEMRAGEEFSPQITIINKGGSVWGTGFARMEESLVCQLIEPLSCEGPDILHWEKKYLIDRKIAPDESFIVNPLFELPCKPGTYVLDLYMVWGPVPVYPAPYRLARSVIKVTPRWKSEIRPILKVNEWIPGETKNIPVVITNQTEGTWSEKESERVYLSGRWTDRFGREIRIDDERNMIPVTLSPDESTEINIEVERPVNSDAKNYYLDLARNDDTWFGQWSPVYIEKGNR